jgi:hypothetical protein
MAKHPTKFIDRGIYNRRNESTKYPTKLYIKKYATDKMNRERKGEYTSIKKQRILFFGRVRRGKWAHKKQVLTCTASICFDFGDIKTFAVQML